MQKRKKKDANYLLDNIKCYKRESGKMQLQQNYGKHVNCNVDINLKEIKFLIIL